MIVTRSQLEKIIIENLIIESKQKPGEIMQVEGGSVTIIGVHNISSSSYHYYILLPKGAEISGEKIQTPKLKNLINNADIEWSKDKTGKYWKDNPKRLQDLIDKGRVKLLIDPKDAIEIKIKGDRFKDYPAHLKDVWNEMGTVSKIVSETLLGATPAGVTIDMRDINAGFTEMVKSGGKSGKADTFFAAGGFFLPVAGDFVKSVYRNLKKVPADKVEDFITVSWKEAADNNPNLSWSNGKIKNELPLPPRRPTLEEVMAVQRPSPPDNRTISLSISSLRPDQIERPVNSVKTIFEVDGRKVIRIEDATGAKRAFYKSSGQGGGTGKGDWCEIEGLAFRPVEEWVPNWYQTNIPDPQNPGKFLEDYYRLPNGKMKLFKNPGYKASGQAGLDTWFVKTHAGKVPPKGTLDELIVDKLKELEAEGMIEPPSQRHLTNYGRDTLRDGLHPNVSIEVSELNNVLKGEGVNTDTADTMIKEHVDEILSMTTYSNFTSRSGTIKENLIKITRGQLSQLVESCWRGHIR